MKPINPTSIVYGDFMASDFPKHIDRVVFRAMYFYLHRELESLNGYDCCSMTADALARCLNTGISIVNVFLAPDHFSVSQVGLLIKGYTNDGMRMNGYIVAVSDIDGIKHAITEACRPEHRFAFTTYEHEYEWLKEHAPEVYTIIRTAQRER